MCPDKEILSAFYDHEVPNPWNDQIKFHLETCTQCAAVLKSFESLGAKLRTQEPVDLEAMKQRISANIASHTTIRPAFWAKPIVLPLPLAAAALFGFCIMGASLFVAVNGGSRPLQEVARFSTQVPVNNENREQVNKMVQTQAKDSRNVVIQLPDELDTAVFGEPSIIQEADFRRSK